jgi:hypothetical protein
MMSHQGRANISAAIIKKQAGRSTKSVIDQALERAINSPIAAVTYRTPEAKSANSERSRIAAKSVRTCWHCHHTAHVATFRWLVGIPKAMECRDEYACSFRIKELWQAEAVR